MDLERILMFVFGGICVLFGSPRIRTNRVSGAYPAWQNPHRV